MINVVLGAASFLYTKLAAIERSNEIERNFTSFAFDDFIGGGMEFLSIRHKLCVQNLGLTGVQNFFR